MFTIEDRIIDEMRKLLEIKYHCEVSTKDVSGVFVVNNIVDGLSYHLKDTPFSMLFDFSRMRAYFPFYLEEVRDAEVAIRECIERMESEMRLNCVLEGEPNEVCMLTKEWILEHVYPQICSLELNNEYLSDKPHSLYADNLACYFVVSSAEEGEKLEAPLTNKIISGAFSNFSVDELMAAALKNMRANREVVFVDARETYLENILISDPGDRYLLNNGYPYGSSVILDAACLGNLRERLGEDYYIIPISMHDLVVQPVSSLQYPASEADFLRKLNSLFPIENTLANHIYRYYADTEQVRCVV